MDGSWRPLGPVDTTLESSSDGSPTTSRNAGTGFGITARSSARPRDLAFGARGLSAAGYEEGVAETGRWLVDQLSDSSVFYTDFHDRFHAASPAEGVDTFPALVLVLAACGCLREQADAVADLAAVHRDRFVTGGLVTGSGSAW
ncbi:hypothetical protein [Natronorubrum sp. DTA7]|uniref:hypothetical protein n=1 Tax=Natronorubrum sp. DTA7 TaxID=3447016 RepID=UPI003F841552